MHSNKPLIKAQCALCPFMQVGSWLGAASYGTSTNPPSTTASMITDFADELKGITRAVQLVKKELAMSARPAEENISPCSDNFWGREKKKKKVWGFKMKTCWRTAGWPPTLVRANSSSWYATADGSYTPESVADADVDADAGIDSGVGDGGFVDAGEGSGVGAAGVVAAAEGGGVATDDLLAVAAAKSVVVDDDDADDDDDEDDDDVDDVDDVSERGSPAMARATRPHLGNG